MPTGRRNRGHNREEDEARELAALSQAARIGEVWWCDGNSLGLSDGGKTRPVLVVGFDDATDVQVLPLTTQKPTGGLAATQVSHRAGLSWLAGDGFQTPRRVPKTALISPLGAWAGFSAWKNLLKSP